MGEITPFLVSCMEMWTFPFDFNKQPYSDSNTWIIQDAINTRTECLYYAIAYFQQMAAGVERKIESNQ